MRPRILIDTSSHHLLNVGDVAMLQVCVERLRDNLPDAELQAVTTAPELLAAYCPDVTPVPAAGRYALTERGAPRLPRSPRLARAALKRTGRRLARREPAAEHFCRALLAADLLVFSGRGGLTDAFQEETDAMLTELEIARRIALPTVLLGQGIGPLEDDRALSRMAHVLPGVELISLREGRAAPGLLTTIGVAATQMAVTGDDAIELAYSARAAELGSSVGLNVRIASYAGVDGTLAQRIGGRVAAAAGELGSDIVAIGISSHPHEDEAVAARAAGVEPSAVVTPTSSIRAAGRCRAVVVGSYHAAVFALAQGVPVVGLAASPYYVDKFLGLRERFGDGCRVVRVGEGEVDVELAVIAAELHRQWEASPRLRSELLTAAEHQVELSAAAHARASAAIATHATAPEARGAAASSG